MLKHAEVGTDDDNVIGIREEYTYGTELTITNKEKMNQLVEDCRRLIDAARDELLNK